MSQAELKEMLLRIRQEGFLRSRDVESAMLKVDRRHFVPASSRALTYENCAMPIGHGQTISAPEVVAFMLDRLECFKGMKVLEIGLGSGYNCALLSVLAGKKGRVISFDIVPELLKLAKENIRKSGIDSSNVEMKTGDASCGYEEGAPYDRIIVTAAMPKLGPKHPLIKQLKPEGKLIAPVGSGFYQDLVLYDNKTKRSEKVLPVVFVPLVGKCGFGKQEASEYKF